MKVSIQIDDAPLTGCEGGCKAGCAHNVADTIPAPPAQDLAGPVIENAADTYALLGKHLENEPQEHFVLVILDVHQRVVPDGIVLLTKGSAVEVNVPIEQIVREVTAKNGRSFVAAHCHPSGVSKPSPADRALTKTIEAAFSDKTGIDVVFIDHLVIGKGSYYSFAEGKQIKVR